MEFDVFGANEEIPRPKNLDEMLYYSKELSKDFKFVRVDFFEANKELYFGEMTFTPFSGYVHFEPDSYDLHYGNKLKLYETYKENSSEVNLSKY